MAEIGEKPLEEESTYRLWRRGVELLEDGSFDAATVPLAEAARRAPEKSSVREALGRAYFRTRRYAEAATEFQAVVETQPVNDFAHFCLGRSL
ncbi:MAG: tetratricopeptide repeat protein, partial [Solirubrobacterales bacterium]